MSLLDDPDKYGDVRHRDASMRHLVQRATGPVSGRHFTLDSDTGTAYNTVNMVSALESGTQAGHLRIFTKPSSALLPSHDQPVLDLSVDETVVTSDTLRVTGGSGMGPSYALDVGGDINFSGRLRRAGEPIDTRKHHRLTVCSGGTGYPTTYATSAFTAIAWHRCEARGTGPTYNDFEWTTGSHVISAPSQGVYSFFLSGDTQQQQGVAAVVRIDGQDLIHQPPDPTGRVCFSGLVSVSSASTLEFALQGESEVDLGTDSDPHKLFLVIVRVG